MGIIGLIPCFWAFFGFSVASLILGIIGRKQIAASNGTQVGGGMATAAVIMGIIGVVLGVAAVVVAVLDAPSPAGFPQP